MDGDWEEIKKPVKKPKPQAAQQNAPAQFGGKAGKGVLMAGAVQQPRGKYGGHQSAAAQHYEENSMGNHA